jgi:Rps23 Pro-64 3,4-dihydroxylase Tpa1-like proline 4-hydroxylase
MINYNISKQLSSNYKISYPFPHIVIDNFLPNHVCDSVLEEVKDYKMWGYDHTTYSENFQINKFFSPWCHDNLTDLQNSAPLTWNLLSYFNSPEFLVFLEDLTGIDNIIPDNTFVGGGIHKINRGGKLLIHADYNIHPDTKLHRRINLLLYLNKNWEKDWGGNLDLWNKTMTERTHSIEPIFNRVVIFNITDDAFHGHPDPLNCPENISRYSLALYYFTEDRPDHEKNSQHAAIWKKIENKNNDVFNITNLNKTQHD